MESLHQQNGQSESHKANFKEAENENFTSLNDNLNIDQELVQKNAAHLNALKDDRNKIRVEKTDENFDLMIRNAQSIDSRTKLLLQENKPLLRRLFPNKTDKLIAEMEKNTIQ